MEKLSGLKFSFLFLTSYFLFCTSASAQKLTFHYVDSLTYSQFMQKQYKELQTIGKQALQQDIDFHYLRMRLGIAYYEEKNYQAALPHFRKALTNYPQDTLIQEYVYYSLLFTGRKAESDELAANFGTSLQEKIGYKDKKVSVIIGLEGSAGITNNETVNGEKYQLQRPQIGMMDSTKRMDAVFNGNLYYGKGLLNLNLKNRFQIYTAFSFFNTNATSRIQQRAGVPPSPPSIVEASYDIANYQYQYNVALSYFTKKEWTLAAGFGYYKEDFGYLKADSFNISTGKLYTHQERSSANYWAASATLAKRFGNLQPTLSLGANNIRGTIQPQLELGFLYYPLGNTNFYGYSALSALKGEGKPQLIVQQKLGFKVHSTIYTEFQAMYGNLQNYTSNSTFLTYNTLDPIKLVLGVNLKIQVKNIEIIPTYTLQQRTGTLRNYTNPQTSTTQSFNYFSHFLTLSFLCKF